jgi:hypothetical protein
MTHENFYAISLWDHIFRLGALEGPKVKKIGAYTYDKKQITKKTQEYLAFGA